MFWSTESKTERLIARYLDPSEPWSAKDDARMRASLRESEALRALYDKRIVAHRLMLGLDAGTPSRVEQERQMTATVGLALQANTAEATSAWGLPAWTMPLAGAAAAALVAVLVTSQPSPSPSPSPLAGAPAADPSRNDYLGARSGNRDAPRAGIGVSGINAQGVEYEVLHDRAWIQDRIRFFYRCDDAELNHLFLFGLQGDENPRWYYPLPAEDEHASIPAQCGSDTERTQLQGDTLLAKRHSPGSLTVIGIFTQDPLSHEAVAQALEGRVNEVLEGAFDDNLRRALSLDPDAVVSVANLWIYNERGADDDER